MNDDFLKVRLLRVVRRYQWLGFWRLMAACWALSALIGAGLVGLGRVAGWSSIYTLPVLAGLAVTFAAAVAIWHWQRPIDLRWVARKIEARHPELKGVLLTAVQQHLEPGVEPGFLQHRVLREATVRSQEHDWRRVVPSARLLAMIGIQLLALGLFVGALAELRVSVAPGSFGGTVWTGADGVTVSPGDASVERGDSFVVLARFGRTLPPAVTMVVREDGATARTVPLVKSLADPVFGGSVPEVAKDFAYHLEYRGERTRDFKVTVYEHPRLVRADVDLAFPGYTKLAPKHIEDTRRVSAVEGTKLDYALQLNKPVKSAKLVARDGKKTEIALQTDPAKPVATLPAFTPEKSQTYDLQLVDADGRANKIAAPFVIDVQPNRVPELRLTAPRGDVRPSALEEVAFDGTVWDDFGTLAYGLAYAIAGAEPKTIELGRGVAAKEKQAFSHLMKLETMGAKPDDLISWYAWADDIGPDGKVRRTSGDMYFAEVRPFEEIFRESQDMQSQDEQQQGQPGQGNPRQRLTELQKQIISATWKLQRDGATPKYADDAKVVTESQEQALAQAQEAQEETRSPREQALWKEATQQMEKAIDRLKDAAKSPAALAQALPAEQAAYQALLKLQSRDTNVTRRNRQRGQQGGGQQANQRQIDQLDLQQAENRYETQRQARAPQNQERREQLAVMNRLQELARRQQDLNERLKELQTSLQEARTEQEREEIRRRLKRLEEEQRQMLADADEMRQRMDRAENQSSMSQQRQQLDQTREDIQRAADAAAEGSVAQALASGTRAQRQLQQMRDEMRKQNSSQFAEDLREMRAEARELSREQEEIGQKLDALGQAGTQRKTLSDAGDRQELLDELTQQKERMNKLVDRAQQVSEQAENTEPLLSRQLYDSVRRVSQDDANSVKQARQELLSSGLMTRDLFDRLQQTSEREGGGKALDLTGELLREGYLPQANQAGQRARGEVDELRRGVERAAESVLGDDAEQLKLAQSELDRLTDELQREMAQAQGRGAGGERQPGQSPQPAGGAQGENQRQAGAQPGEAGQPGGEPRAGERPGQRGERSGELAGNNAQRGQPGSQPGQTPGEQPSGEPGEQPGQQAGAGQQGGQQAGATAPQPGGSRGNRDGQRGGRGGALTVEDVLAGADQRGGRRERTGAAGGWGAGPLLGDDFGPWVERLRDVETLLDAPELRTAVADARERARLMRRDYTQELKKPDWADVQLKIVKPLVEVRSRVAEELARRGTKDPLAPIDRDPVPNRYAESVRRYYEELGKDKPEATR